MFSTDGILISVSAAPHCKGKRRKRKKKGSVVFKETRTNYDVPSTLAGTNISFEVVLIEINPVFARCYLLCGQWQNLVFL